MGHTPGVTPDDGGEVLFTKHCERPVEMLQHVGENWFFDQPGTQYRHSIYDWILVSAAIEAATGQPCLEFMRERIFDPLGISETIPDSACLAAGQPHLEFIRELISDPDATRGSSRASTKKSVQEHVASYSRGSHRILSTVFT